MASTKDLRLTTVMELDAGLGSVISVEIAGHLAIVSGGVGKARVLATTDGKKLYKRATPSRRGLRGTRVIGDELWMVGEYGLCAVSDDRGETWTDVATPNQECLWDIVRDKKGVLWICGSGATILRGDAKTRKFKAVKHELKPRDDRADPRIELVPAGVLFPLFNALWNGKTFVKPKGLKGAMAAVAIGPTGTIVVVGDKGVGARSTDGGKTFTATKLGAVTVHFNDVAAVAGGFVAVGDKGTMRRSDDDGVTWKPLASGTKVPLWSIGSWGDGAYVGGESGLVLRLDTPGDTYWKGAVDDLKPKPIVPATFKPLVPPTAEQREARFVELYAAATAEHQALAEHVAPPRAVADDHDATILAAIDDVDAYRVYGDVLQGRGDPRGELVALQATEGHAKQATAYLKAHRAELLGAAADAKGLKLDWRWGFIHHARIAAVGELGEDGTNPKSTVVAVLGALLAEPSARFLQSLSVGIVQFEENTYDAVIKNLATNALPALRSLFLGDFSSDETEVSWSSIGDLAKLYPAVGSLESLKLRSGNMKLGRIVLPRLRTLAIETGGLDKVALKAIVNATLPSLETLSLFFGNTNYGCDVTRKDVMALLAVDHFPRLSRLGLCNSELTDELCQHLHTAPLVAQVRELDLSRGTLSDKGARGLATYGAGFAHLDKLDVSNNYLTKDGIRVVEKALPNAHVIVGKQREESDYGRYVTLGE